MRVRKNIEIYICIIAGWLFCWSSNLYGQQEPLFTQYMNNPLLMNPAFAGTRNSLAMDMFVRLQWVGMQDAPATYYYGVHTPINDTKMSVGGNILSDHVGPVMTNQLSFVYSYLVRTGLQSFISFGISGGLNNYWANLSGLRVVNQSDPHFSGRMENEFRPTFGTGAVLFTPDFYLSVSVPQVLNSQIRYTERENHTFDTRRHYYLTTGYRFHFNPELNARISSLARIVEDDINTYDFHMHFTYNNFLKLGGAYRINNAAALIVGIQINENWGVNYSYDFPLYSNTLHNISSQEISITFDSFRFVQRNRDREFRRAAEDGGVRSFRYF
ncbi:PorP/SprF family type IX secretion system membrane protein [Alkalitalea saponilacus]|nr:type IX secretion system membrane protein PorP/SprF [Alkalitalea saponilacus]ASB47997.1 hypothetical protein CDL62_01920 [Alkalitalea saponilacus]